MKVVPEGIKDEYADLINPILTLLTQNAPEEVLDAVIHQKLTCDYDMPVQ